jgi:hypothetical protein
MEKTLELVVEKRKEHSIDIYTYVRAKLKIRDEVIEKEPLKKASGIFLWVLLVIVMLNKAYQEGKVEAMR